MQKIIYKRISNKKKNKIKAEEKFMKISITQQRQLNSNRTKRMYVHQLKTILTLFILCMSHIAATDASAASATMKVLNNLKIS